MRTTDFGRPDRNHSVTQEACGETIFFFLLKYVYLDEQSVHALYETNLLVPHMARMMDTLSHYVFRWIKNTVSEWASQTAISKETRKAMMACLFHYNLDMSLLVRYLGGNHTGAYRDVHKTFKILLAHGISMSLV